MPIIHYIASSHHFYSGDSEAILEWNTELWHDLDWLWKWIWVSDWILDRCVIVLYKIRLSKLYLLNNMHEQRPKLFKRMWDRRFTFYKILLFICSYMYSVFLFGRFLCCPSNGFESFVHLMKFKLLFRVKLKIYCPLVVFVFKCYCFNVL